MRLLIIVCSMGLRVQIASDLHLEFPQNRVWLDSHPLEPAGDVLVLAGDTIPRVLKDEAVPFIEKVASRFELVILIPGNHEFYHGTARFAYPSLNERIHDHVVWLNNATMEWEGVRFLCTTLWTDIPPVYQYEARSVMNDYRVIRREETSKSPPLAPRDTVMFYNISNRYLERELAKSWEGKTVVVTHHAPHPSLSMDAYPVEAVRHAYATDMAPVMRDNDIDLWIFGHVHRSFDVTIEGTRVVSNPLGYYNEYQKQDFDPSMVIEL